MVGGGGFIQLLKMLKWVQSFVVAGKIFKVLAVTECVGWYNASKE